MAAEVDKEGTCIDVREYTNYSTEFYFKCR